VLLEKIVLIKERKVKKREEYKELCQIKPLQAPKRKLQ
jgi:hypothetical protein